MVMTNAERQARFRERKLQAGYKSVTVLVPVYRFADFGVALQLLRDNPHLEVASLRDTRTGRFVSLKK